MNLRRRWWCSSADGDGFADEDPLDRRVHPRHSGTGPTPGERPRALVRMRLRLHHSPGASGQHTVPANEPSRPPRESDRARRRRRVAVGWALPSPATSPRPATRWPSSTAARRRSPAAGDFSGQTIVGIGFDRDRLLEAGIEHAVRVAAVTNGDNSNILIARVARETFGIEDVVARIYDPRRAAIYQRLGIATVATVAWTTERVLRRILPSEAAVEWIDPSPASRWSSGPSSAPGRVTRCPSLEEAGQGPGRRGRPAGRRTDPSCRPGRPGRRRGVPRCGRRRARRGRRRCWPPVRPREGTDASGHRRRRQRRDVHRRQLHETRARRAHHRQRPGRGRSAERSNEPGGALAAGRRVRGHPSWPRRRSTRPTSSPRSPVTTRTTW